MTAMAAMSAARPGGRRGRDGGWSGRSGGWSSRSGGWSGRSGGWRRRRGAVAGGLLLAVALGVAGCGSSSHNSDSKAGAVAPANGPGSSLRHAGGSDAARGAQDGPGTGAPAPGGTGPAGAPGTPGSPQSSAAFLVRTADLTVRTPHVERQLAAARSLAVAAGGYAGDEDTAKDEQGNVRSTVQLRVPPRSYDLLLTRLAGLGTLVSRQVKVEDVTGDMVDVTSRIASQKASVARVRALMDRAGSIGDVVSLEGELTSRESALEALEAQQASLRSRTGLATISLTLQEPPAKARPARHKTRHEGFWTAVGHGLRNGWHALAAALRGLLVVLAAALPFLGAGGLVWALYRLARRVLPARGPGRRAATASLRGPDGAARGLPAYPGTAPAPVPAPARSGGAAAAESRETGGTGAAKGTPPEAAAPDGGADAGPGPDDGAAPGA